MPRRHLPDGLGEDEGEHHGHDPAAAVSGQSTATKPAATTSGAVRESADDDAAKPVYGGTAWTAAASAAVEPHGVVRRVPSEPGFEPLGEYESVVADSANAEAEQHGNQPPGGQHRDHLVLEEAVCGQRMERALPSPHPPAVDHLVSVPALYGGL